MLSFHLPILGNQIVGNRFHFFRSLITALFSPYRLELFTNSRFVGGIVSHIVTQSFLWYTHTFWLHSCTQFFRYLLVLYGGTGDGEDEALNEVRDAFEETFGRRIEYGWVILDNWVMKCENMT